MEPLWHEAADEQLQLFPVVRQLESTEQRGIHSDDHPFFYDPNTAEVFVGPLGAFHLDMFGTHPDPERRQYYVSQYLRNINKPSFGWGGRVHRNGELRWYDDWLAPDEQKIPEETRPHVERAIRQELNLPTPARRQAIDYDDEDLWRESHVRWIPQPSLMQSFLAAHGINVIQSTPEQSGQRPGELETQVRDDFKTRIPFRYDPVEGNVYIGQPRYFHHEVPTPDEVRGSGRLKDGYVWTHRNTVDWYKEPEQYEKLAVERAIANHLGVPELKSQPQADYNTDAFWDW